MQKVVLPAPQSEITGALEILAVVIVIILLGFAFSFNFGLKSPVTNSILKEDDDAKTLNKIRRKVDTRPQGWDQLKDKELFMLAKHLVIECELLPAMKDSTNRKLIRLVNARKVSKQTLEWIYANAVDTGVDRAVLASPKLTIDEKVFLSLQPGRK